MWAVINSFIAIIIALIVLTPPIVLIQRISNNKLRKLILGILGVSLIIASISILTIKLANGDVLKEFAYILFIVGLIEVPGYGRCGRRKRIE